MDYDLKELKENPCVYKADYRSITLKTAFRVKLFMLWKQGDMPAMRQMLEDNGLGPDMTGRYFIDKLVLSFQMAGYPLNKKNLEPVYSYVRKARGVSETTTENV